MSLQTDRDLIYNLDFKGRIASAIFRAVGDIRNQTTGLPANHAQRLGWANRILDLNQADQVAGWMSPLIVGADPDLRFAYEQNGDQADIGDASILNGVNGLVDIYVAEHT